MTDIALPRETGSEKAGVCPIHGEQLPAVTSGYGSKVAGACPVCATAGGGDTPGELEPSQLDRGEEYDEDDDDL